MTDENRVSLDLATMEEEDLQDLMLEILDDDDDDGGIDDRIELRRYVAAMLKIDEETAYLKKEYKPALKAKYLDPLDEKIKTMADQKEKLKDYVLEFLQANDEKSVALPDLATVGIVNKPSSVIYPEKKEEEEKILQRLHDQDSEFVKVTLSFNKEKIKKHFSATKELPFEGLMEEDGGQSIRLSKKKVS